jgi:serine/threonine protein phosphatase PrpC
MPYKCTLLNVECGVDAKPELYRLGSLPNIPPLSDLISEWSDSCATRPESIWLTGMPYHFTAFRSAGVGRSAVRAFSQILPRLRCHPINEGVTTALEDAKRAGIPNRSPFYFETGYSAFAKRASRPFPPPFLSLPSGSLSDPLTTNNHTRDRLPGNGDIIQGLTNGDDALIIGGQCFLGVNDGVGAWAQRERGHAALWSRLIAHFWALEVENAYRKKEEVNLEDINLIAYLQKAYERTKTFTSKPNEVLGTTTVSSALLHHRSDNNPVVIATVIGDCTVLVIRPSNQELIYETKEQWHWFDCPRQLGTNSPDTPERNAVADIVDIQEEDVVVVMSDGVTDNLWKHEICEKVSESVKKWQEGDEIAKDGMVYVARELMKSAKEIAQDPYAESPYMERALDEGIAAEGGKLDDISVIVGLCKKRKI